MSHRVSRATRIFKPLIFSVVSLTSVCLMADEPTIGTHYDVGVLLTTAESPMNGPQVFDINGDGRPDVVFATGQGEDDDALQSLEIWTSNAIDRTCLDD